MLTKGFIFASAKFHCLQGFLRVSRETTAFLSLCFHLLLQQIVLLWRICLFSDVCSLLIFRVFRLDLHFVALQLNALISAVLSLHLTFGLLGDVSTLKTFRSLLLAPGFVLPC